MKKINYLVLLCILFVCFNKVYAQVGIGTTNPDPTSILDITSTTQGVLTPRMTTAQRIAITTPAQGLLVFDTDLTTFYFYNGTTWVPLTSTSTANGLYRMGRLC